MKFKLILSLLLCVYFVSGCNQQNSQNTDQQYDLVVYGGTSAGVIAAYSASKMGKTVVIIEPGNRLGGLSSGGLGQTDIGNKHAVTGLSRDFYRRLGDYYNNFEQWKFEPKAALEVYQQYVEEEDIPVLYQKRIIKAQVDNKSITSITLENSENPEANPTQQISGKMFIDCSYEGDLMALAGVSYTVGRESNQKYGETINGVQLMEGHQFPDGIDPYVVKGDPSSGLLWGIGNQQLAADGSGDDKVQAYNFRICLTDSAENRVPVTRPDNYDSTRYELLLRLIETRQDDNLYNYFIWSRMPNRKTDINNRGGFSTDMIGANWDFPEASYSEREEIIQDHVDYTKGLLYFWGHDPRVPENARNEMLKWGYPKDEYLENDHFSPQLYVREARRLVGEYVMTEHHCLGDSIVSDPIGLAAYTMDSHNCQRLVVDGMVKNEGNVEVGGFPPYPISYRALLPKKEEVNNLFVPVCLSASHIAFGSIRMEPVFMVLGQVSAMAASMAIDEGISVHEVDVEKLRQKYDHDPFLDGTTPDVLIDDADKARITQQGDWESQSHFMRNYKTSLLYSRDQSENVSVKFDPEIKKSGNYKVYYYCPQFHWDYDEDLPEFSTIMVKHNGGEDKIKINYRENSGDWAYLGQYSFNDSGDQFVQLMGSESDYPLIADAVLLVSEN